LKKIENRQEQGDVEFPENYFKYKLKGIVIHQGMADNGHYYSFIQDREK
jgi:ubiquitin C-terminal hydrolase